jgi:SAM-dependent methyltransferase
MRSEGVDEVSGMHSTNGHSSADARDPQREANDRLWARSSLVARYAHRVLRPVEVMILVRYREQLSGRVLELGCGAGRVTGYLAEIATAAHGIDISSEMVAYCRRRYPRATFSQADLRDLVRMDPGSYDAIVAIDQVLDVLDDGDRSRVLDGIHEVLPTDGLLVLSAHNLAYAPHLADPLKLRGMGPGRAALTLARWPRWQVNRRRLRRFERAEAGYSILNDISHDYMALHYYIGRDAQESQLAAHGFELLEVLDPDGRVVERGDDPPDAPWLHYLARRRA